MKVSISVITLCCNSFLVRLTADNCPQTGYLSVRQFSCSTPGHAPATITGFAAPRRCRLDLPLMNGFSFGGLIRSSWERALAIGAQLIEDALITLCGLASGEASPAAAVCAKIS